MKIPYCRAEIINKSRVVEGFYFAYPETTCCFTEDYIGHPVKIKHCIVTYMPGDWGLPNNPRCIEIDNSTLEIVGYYETSYDYDDSNTTLIERIKENDTERLNK